MKERTITLSRALKKWYSYLNRQQYSDCQIVTAVNAYFFLTGKIIKPDSPQYEDFLNMCGSKIGSAIAVERVHKILGIKTTTKFRHRLDLTSHGKKIVLPVEVNLWHKRTGYHSALIVDHCLKAQCFQITNFRYETTHEGWIFIENMYQYENDMNKGWTYRLFELEK